MIALGYILSIGYLGFVLLLSRFCKEKLGAPAEISRKTAHLLLSFTWVIYLVFFQGTMHLVLVSLLGVLIITTGLVTNKLKMLQREKEADNKGVFLYALSQLFLSIIITIYPSTLVVCTYGFFCMGIGDGVAALIGIRFGRKTQIFKNGKSLAGSIGCFLFSFMAMTVVSVVMQAPFFAWKMVVLALVATLVEFWAGKYDNIIIGMAVTGIGTLLGV